jgi:hypothetical protein
MLFKEVMDVCFENHTVRINTLFGQNAAIRNTKSNGTYSNHRALGD